MKTLRSFLVGLLITTTSLFAVSAANAGQLSTVSASISWDDSTFYEPSACTNYTFDYTASNKVLIADILISNRFNDKIGSTSFFGPNSGRVSVQVCKGTDLSGAKVVLDVKGSKVYGGTDDIVSAPITFLSRSGKSTATPAPAPTVYVENPSDKNLADLVTSLKSEVSLLKAKIKRICSVKPKPKGC